MEQNWEHEKQVNVEKTGLVEQRNHEAGIKDCHIEELNGNLQTLQEEFKVLRADRDKRSRLISAY